jgi:hypothetical protein
MYRVPECQVQSAELGPPPPPPLASVASQQDYVGGATLAYGVGSGGDPIQTTGQADSGTLYNIIPLRLDGTLCVPYCIFVHKIQTLQYRRDSS